jgi:hypothetical protein
MARRRGRNGETLRRGGVARARAAFKAATVRDTGGTERKRNETLSGAVGAVKATPAGVDARRMARRSDVAVRALDRHSPRD